MGTKLSTDKSVNKNKSKSSVMINAGIKRPTKPDHDFLSEEEEIALHESWELIKKKDPQLVGINLLLRIFEIEPKTKETFKSFRHLNDQDLLHNPMFKSHAIRFMKAVEVTIENLHALEVIIIPNLKHLGKIHTTIELFKLCYLRVVEQAFDEVWERIFSAEDISVDGFPDKFPLQLPHAKKSMNGSSSSLSRSLNSLKKYKKNENNNCKNCKNNNCKNNNCKNNNCKKDNDTSKNSNNYSTTKAKKISKHAYVYNGPTREAWIKVVCLITSKITEGYNESTEAKKLKEEKKIQQLQKDLEEKLKFRNEEEEIQEEQSILNQQIQQKQQLLEQQHQKQEEQQQQQKQEEEQPKQQ